MLYGLLLAVLVLAGCAGPSPGVVAPPAAADRVVALPSGATLKVVADWTVTAAPEGLILQDPVWIDPGVRGFEFAAPAASGVYTRLRLRNAQHSYEYESD